MNDPVKIKDYIEFILKENVIRYIVKHSDRVISSTRYCNLLISNKPL
jgi:hypothetical protein